MASPTPLGIHQISSGEQYALVADLNRVGVTADAAIAFVKARAEYLTDKAVGEIPGRVAAEVDRVIGDTREDAAEALVTANKAYEYNQALVAPAAAVVNAVVTDPASEAGALVASKIEAADLPALVRELPGAPLSVRAAGIRPGGDRAWDAEMAALIAKAKDERRPILLDLMGYITLDEPLVIDFSTDQAMNRIFPGIIGTGYQSGFRSRAAEAGRAAVEIVGSDHTRAVNTLAENFRILVSPSETEAGRTAQRSMYCLKVGDARNFFTARRVWLDGPNGLSMRVNDSSSYAHLGTRFEQLAVETNYGGSWWDDPNDPALNDCTAYAVSCIAPDWGGAMPDNPTFSGCHFSGLTLAKGFVLTYDSCEFTTNPNRPRVNGIPHGGNILYQGIGVLNARNCYFEDHHTAITVSNGVGSVAVANIDGCLFTGSQNYKGPRSVQAQRAIHAIGYANGNVLGSVNIRGCGFGYYPDNSRAPGGYANRPILVEGGVEALHHQGSGPHGYAPWVGDSALVEDRRSA